MIDLSRTSPLSVFQVKCISMRDKTVPADLQLTCTARQVGGAFLATALDCIRHVLAGYDLDY